MSSPLVSFIIPCYNGEAFVAEAIESAINQTFSETEVIVVDDGSTDGSSKILSKYNGRIKVIHQENQGLATARNVGVRRSKGKFLAFLDCDDYVSTDFAKKLFKALIDENADIAYCGWQNIGLPGGRGKPYIPPDYRRLSEPRLFFIEKTPWPVHAVLIRKAIVEKYNSFDKRWRTCEDFALWIYATESAKIVPVKEVLSFYRHHDQGQMTKNRSLIAINHWKIQQEYLRSRPEVVKRYGKKRINQITQGRLMKRGYECYWARELRGARAIFRIVMSKRYGSPYDWLYMLPSFLPLRLHKKILQLKDKKNINKHNLSF